MKKYILAFLILVSILAVFFRLYERFFEYHITAKFSESGPLYVNMPVYYKGYKIGRTKEIKPSEDYKYTFVKIILYAQKPKLPEDIAAKAKKLDMKKDYIDLITPDEPSTTLLKNGGTIKGEPAFDMDAFLSDIADADVLIPLLQNFSDVLVSANKTSGEVKNFFSELRSTLKDNRQNLNQTTTDVALSAKSLAKITSRFNNSITEEKIKNTTSNVDKSSTNIRMATENIKNITTNVNSATKNLDKTVAKIDCTISEVNTIATNLKVITGGFCEVLGKRFAGLRIIFGKPINNYKCSKNCTK